MKSPLDPRFRKIQQLHLSGQMVGQDRPVGRVTWAKQGLRSTTSSKSGVETLRYLAKNVTEHEIGNVRTIDIDRSVGQDSATCTINMYNVRPDSSKPEGIDTAGTKGYLTYNRGEPVPAVTSVFTGLYDPINPARVEFPTDWLYPENSFRDVFIPNTVLRTYQGYGSDNFDEFGNVRDTSDALYVSPKNDSQIYQTGVWLIDRVTYNADGTMTVECRDLGKLLIEQYIYPPMIPVNRFPLIYCPAHKAYGHKEEIGKNVAHFHSSSVDQFYGKDARIHGHRGSHAFDTKPDSFWLSGGNSAPTDVAWLQASVRGKINEVVLNTWGKNYTVYVSVHEHGKWQGKVDEIQRITLTGHPTGGTWTLTYNGQTTAAIAYNASAATVQSALVALSNIVTGDVSVTGAARGPYTVVFTGNNSGDNVNQMTAHDSLTGGSSPAVTVETVRQGANPVVTGSQENLAYEDSSGDGPGYFYVITHGDTLWALAGRYYGDNLKWPIIARANNNIIKDPHWIYPGERIRIPYVAGTSSPPPSGTGATGGSTVSIPYVMKSAVPSTGKVTIHLPRTYDAKYVRVTFKSLYKYSAGDYRAGVRTMTVRNHVLSTYHPSSIGKAGYIQDWTEPIKELCSWAGLTWENASPNPADPVLGSTRGGNPLRVWGDFEILGAGPVVCTPADYFMSKSFMDGIRQVADFIGGIFFIDETGGAQFRLPNIWTGGNFIDDTAALSTLGARIAQHPIEFHEDVNLLSYQAVISDQSIRSEVLVIGGYPSQWSTGPIAGGYVLGYNQTTHTTSAIDFTDVLAGQYRLMVVPGDSTKLFYTERECQRMAELTALFILLTYRQGSLKSPAHPGLQLDDQVRIFERTTHESNIHYVSAIQSHQDLESGEYMMDVTTHWLGKDPDTDWFVNKAQLTPAVMQLPAILARVGKEAGGDNFEQPPYGSG